MMIHLAVKHPLRQPLLQLIDQTTALKYRRRVTARKQRIYHLIRDSTLSVRRHKLYSFPPFPRASLIMAEHKISDTLFNGGFEHRQITRRSEERRVGKECRI